MNRHLVTAALVSATLFGAFETGIVQIHPPSPASVQADTQGQVKHELGTFAKLAKSLKPSVVNIAVDKISRVSSTGPDELLRRFMQPGGEEGVPSERHLHGQGSGVIISSDGYIMTNNHVVTGAQTVKVTLSDGRELPAKVIGTDPKTDLALVKVVSTTALPAAQLGDSDQLDVGDWVMAIGNPFGLDATVTVGVLSGKGRNIGAGPYDDFLQTDASINPGNSGGPLFNTNGEVVGINTAILPNGQGIGFSIPVNLAKNVVDQLKTNGQVKRGFLGVGIQPLNANLRQALGLPGDLRGALVSNVLPKGPAAQGGVQVQDVVLSINGHTVLSDRDLLAQVARSPIGSSAELVVQRGNQTRTLHLTISERPDDKLSQATPPQLETRPVSVDMGLEVQPLTQEIGQQLSTSDLKGVVVVGVTRDSAAARAGLQSGDIVRKVGSQYVASPDEFNAAVKHDRRISGNVALLVERQGNTVFLVLEI